MFTHPLLEALFNPELSVPSKQLQQSRSEIFRSTAKPTIAFILPPKELLNEYVDVETLFEDNFLFAHVIDTSDFASETFPCVGNPSWSVMINVDSITPLNGFPPHLSQEAKITRSYLWRPGITGLNFDATFMIFEVQSWVYSPEMGLKRRGWLGPNRSSVKTDKVLENPAFKVAVEDERTISDPISLEAASRNKHDQENSSVGLNPDLVPLSSRRVVRNPALNLTISVPERDKAVAKVDYCIACLQQNVGSSQELAKRFHKIVRDVKLTLEDYGGVFDTSETDDFILSPSPRNMFRLEEIYDYAEAKLGSSILKQLDDLLESERDRNKPKFSDVRAQLCNLDVTQVDIPGLKGSSICAFEQAITEAALVLGHLSDSVLSADMCRTFLRAMSFLVDPKLGTVSADTLLGLFLLTILRTSHDALKVLERDVFFVISFSFQASNNILARASAGRLSYTLMVVESVMLYVQHERERLHELSKWNKKMWQATRGDDRDGILQVLKASRSSILTRKNGKSALFMAIEDANASLLKFLISDKAMEGVFSREFILQDRDTHKQTLLMASLKADRDNIEMSLTSVLMEILEIEDVSFYRECDLSGRHLGYYAETQHQIDFVVGKLLSVLDWTHLDKTKETAIIHQAKTNLSKFSCFISVAHNFYDHIDAEGNSMLHFVCDDLELTKSVYQIQGCNVNWKNKKSQTSLLVSSNEDVSKFLLEKGADPWAMWDPTYQNLCSSVHHARGCVVTAPLDASGSEETRMLEYVDNDESSGGKIIYSESSKFIVTPEELAKHLCLLENVAPTSWVPTLEFHHSRKSDLETRLGQLFFRDLTFDDNIRIAVWIKQLRCHPVLGNLPEMKTFMHTEHNESDKNSPVEQSPLGSEDESSMTMFLNLGSERLESVHDALNEVVRHMSRVKDLVDVQNRLNHKAEYKMERFAHLLNSVSKVRGMTQPIEFKPMFADTTSFSDLISILTVSQLAKFVRDIQKRLRGPLGIVESLNVDRELLLSEREELKTLAATKPKPAWLSSFESKRVAKIEELEHSVASRKKRVSEMELKLRATHYSLATELGAFNNLHEEELIQRIKIFSLRQLQKHKEQVSLLQFGYKPRTS